MKRYLCVGLLSVIALAGCNSSLFSSATSLQSLLNGGTSALSSNSINNAAGFMGYCVQNKVLNDTGISALKDKLNNALGSNAQQSTDYKNGLLGILNTQDGKTVDLGKFSPSSIVDQVKQKACDLAMSQAKAFL